MPFQPFLLLAACLFLLDPVLSVDDDPKVTFTTNATAVDPSQPFTARCQVDGYEVKRDEYLAFMFCRKKKNSTDSDEMIQYLDNVDSSGERHWSISYNNKNHPDLAIDLHRNITYPTCEVSMHPTKLAEYDYYCRFTSGGLPRYYDSNHVTVATRESEIRTNFTSDVSEVVAGEPFTGTCQLEGLANAATRNYSVQFWSSEGLLGTYIVYAPKQSTAKPLILFKETKQDNTTVSRGEHAAYPTFDIQINSTTNASQTFWCTLIDEKKLEYKSNIWPAPAVTFTANVSIHEDGIPFAGRCLVNEAPPANTTYSVGFYAGQIGLLATYVVRADESLDLVIEAHHPNVTISQGTSLQLPTYELSINLTGPSQPFWCTLQIGQHAEAKEYKSNELTL